MVGIHCRANTWVFAMAKTLSASNNACSPCRNEKSQRIDTRSRVEQRSKERLENSKECRRSMAYNSFENIAWLLELCGKELVTTEARNLGSGSRDAISLSGQPPIFLPHSQIWSLTISTSLVKQRVSIVSDININISCVDASQSIRNCE